MLISFNKMFIEYEYHKYSLKISQFHGTDILLYHVAVLIFLHKVFKFLNLIYEKQEILATVMIMFDTAPSPETCEDNNGECAQICTQKSKFCVLGKCVSCRFNSYHHFCTKYVKCSCRPGYRLGDDRKSCAGK